MQKMVLTKSSETYSTSRHNLGFYRCVGLTARYSVPCSSLKDKSLESVIEHAVAQTILSHPILQVGILNEDTRTPQFVYLPTLDLSRLIIWEHSRPETPADRDSALQRVLETRHSSLWPDIHRQPGYQFIAVCPYLGAPPTKGTISVDIVFAYHHGYGDGPSGTILQRTLLRALNNPVSVPSLDKSSHILTINNPSPLAPPQESLIDFKISWPYFIKTLWAEFAPSFLKPAPPEPAWTGKPITPHPENTRIRLVTLSSEVLSDILKRCREHSTTLTPLLHILVLHSLAKRLPDTEHAKAGFSAVTPISLRRLLPPGGKKGFHPDESMGVVLVGQTHRFAADAVRQIRKQGGTESAENLVWDLTSSLSDEIKQKVVTLPNDDAIGLMAWVSDWNERWLKMVGKNRESTWEVSNVGAIDFEKDGAWMVDRVVFSQSGHVAGAAFSVSVAGVKGADLTITLSWQESIISDELADGLEEDLREWLTGFARTGRFGVTG
jgi:hypothetical protein